MRRLVSAFTAAVAALAFACAPLTVRAQSADEAQIGQQVYQELAQKGEIIPSSPWYGLLNQIGQRIAAVASPQYQFPFHFILVNEKQPNAFAVPGGNVYVTLPLMTFVKNEYELAGVLCHETSHDIHHDVVHLAQKQQTTGLVALGISLLLGGAHNGIVNGIVGAAAQLQDLHFSRDVEEAADQKGAATCAQAGYNPWGMIWLFQEFSKASAGGQMEMLSDHPSDQHRINALKQLFASNPETFGRYRNDIDAAPPMPSLAALRERYGNARPAGVALR